MTRELKNIISFDLKKTLIILTLRIYQQVINLCGTRPNSLNKILDFLTKINHR